MAGDDSQLPGYSRGGDDVRVELDHVFVCTRELQADVRRLTAFGMRCGSRTRHRGQGTANACFFFDNAYLELLSVADEVELGSDAVRPTSLSERLQWDQTGACPVGIALRPSGSAVDELPIQTWGYEAPFLQPGATIPVATPREEATTPLVFFSMESAPPAVRPAQRRPPLEHLGQRRVLTGVALRVPMAVKDAFVVEWLAGTGLVDVSAGDSYRVQLEWDEGAVGSVRDFDPVLPLSVRW